MGWSCAACAGATGESARSVLAEAKESGSAPVPAAAGREGAVAIPFRPPDRSGSAYRIVLETGGEREVDSPQSAAPIERQEESHLLELEYTELPTDAPRDVAGAYLVRLDGLHYRLLQSEPKAEREIEIADDRLRVMAGKKEGMDLRGAQPSGDLTPRKVLGEIFGLIAHDGMGEPVVIQPLGVLVARNLLRELPVRQALAWTRLPLPQEVVTPGARWHAVRFPADPVGAAGLGLDVSYTLAGFANLEGVPCAWIALEATLDASDIASAVGFRFDRAVASVQGEAWVELATSRVKRMVVTNEARASYRRGAAPAPVVEHRLRYRGRTVMESRDPAEKPTHWADGSERFGRR